MLLHDRGCVARIVSRVGEEIAPVFFFFFRARRLLHRAEALDILKTSQNYVDYATLTEEQLSGRLIEERQRGASLDEKTFKLTLSLAIGLTVLGTGATALVRELPPAAERLVVATGLAASIGYILGGGFLALGAMRSLRSYGYGTAMLLVADEERRNALAEALARQEIVNTVRSLRNEASYQMLRNGFVILMTTLVIFACLLAFNAARETFSV